MLAVALGGMTALPLVGCDTPPSPQVSAALDAGSTISFADLAKIDSGVAVAPVDAGRKRSLRTSTDCVAKDGTIDFHGDQLLEADVRKKLQKLAGPIHESDLKTIKSINISGGTVDALDPCIFPRLTAMRDLFVGPGTVDDLTPLANLVQMRSLRVSVSQVTDLTPLDKLGVHGSHRSRAHAGAGHHHARPPRQPHRGAARRQLGDRHRAALHLHEAGEI